jgi:hypothetical protein
MATDTDVRLAVYSAFAETGRQPEPEPLARSLGLGLDELREAYARMAGSRLLVLERDGVTIRMAPPFSGVPTQHVVVSGGVQYWANCAWDALGIPAALRRAAEVRSRCEQSREPFTLRVGTNGPEPSDWLFHSDVPAARWWKDIVFT